VVTIRSQPAIEDCVQVVAVKVTSIEESNPSAVMLHRHG
jgi:hypothetical protein